MNFRLTRAALLSAASALVVASLTGLAACSSVVVKGNSPPQTTPAFYLRGRSLVALKTEADRLCPHGYVATREWQSYEGPDHSGHVLKNALAYVWDWVAPPAFDGAQMDVQCNQPPRPSASAPAGKPQPAEVVPQS